MRVVLLVLSMFFAVAISAPFVIQAGGPPFFPGNLTSSQVGSDQGAAVIAAVQDEVQGRTFRMTSILSDAEQTLIAYQIDAAPEDDPYIHPAHGPRIILPDGSIVGYRFIQGSRLPDGRGTISFPPLPPGKYKAILEINGLDTRPTRGGQSPTTINARFAVALAVDNEFAFANSSKVIIGKQAGRSKGTFTLAEVSRTSSMIVIRGTIDGLNVDEIQRLGRPDVRLVDSEGEELPFENGRLGFGDDYRQTEFRFPATVGGPVKLVIGGLSPSSADDAIFEVIIP